MSLISRLLCIPDKSTVPYRYQSLEGLAARWVQWGASSSMYRNPINDTTGKFAGINQPDDVWFLAGCFGGVVSRSCTVPANKKLFFPIFNMWFDEGYELGDLSKIYGYLKIDGENIELDHVYGDKPFTVKGVLGNPVTGSIFSYPMHVCGLWKLIEPLSPGQHEIYFKGGDGYGFIVDVTYIINVESE